MISIGEGSQRFRLILVECFNTVAVVKIRNMGNKSIEARLEKMGLVLPEQEVGPDNARQPFAWIRIRGNRAYLAGHGPLNHDGTVAEPLGKVGAELTLEQGYRAARLCALSMLASLKRELGELDRVAAWLRVLGMINVAPGFTDLPQVMNGFTDLIHDLYGIDRGKHARSAVGMAQLPFGIPVEIEAEVEILV